MGASYEVQDIPADLVEKAEQYRAELVEAVAEASEELMEKYLEEGELTIPEIKAGIRQLVISGEAFPVLCGSAFKNRGVQPMLDAVIEYLPSPLDVPDVVGSNPSNEEEKLTRKASADEPFAALAFKVAAHPFYGQLTYTRVSLRCLQLRASRF